MKKNIEALAWLCVAVVAGLTYFFRWLAVEFMNWIVGRLLQFLKQNNKRDGHEQTKTRN